MSNLSIYEKKWLDLVFEGRNQAYGAYQLRIQNPKTTMLSLLMGIVLFAFTLSGFLIQDHSAPAVAPLLNPDIPIVVVNYKQPLLPPENKNVLPVVKEQQKKVTKEKLVNVTIVSEKDNPDDIMTNSEAAKANVTTSEGANTGEISARALINLNGGTSSTESIPVIASTLDKLPEFPGGINKFLSYVGTHFREPDFSSTSIDHSNKIRVIVSFVIEKDGSMTDIKVLRDPGYRLGEEAIRVLKSQQTKWRPGIKNGQAVRTLYTLPITIIPQ